MRIWVDDLRPAPPGWTWCKSVDEVISCISHFTDNGFWDDDIDLISLDHDAGDFFTDGGDYIRVLDWLEEYEYNIPIHLHTMNPVGRQNMRRIIERNKWKEVYFI